MMQVFEMVAEWLVTVPAVALFALAAAYWLSRVAVAPPEKVTLYASALTESVMGLTASVMGVTAMQHYLVFMVVAAPVTFVAVAFRRLLIAARVRDERATRASMSEFV